jgi:hypothetical protein
MATVRLEVLGQWKNPVTSWRIEPAAFRLVAQCLNKLRYRVPPRYYHNYIETSHISRNTMVQH